MDRNPNLIPKEIDIWTGRKIAEKLGFREHPKVAGLYLRDMYSNDFEGGDEDAEFISCYHTGAQTDKCIASARLRGGYYVYETEIMRTHGKYQRLKKFIELRNGIEKATGFLMKEGQDVD